MTIALAMIARDEQRSIGRALASAAPYVDEMILLDTGSVDDTRAIARSHGARVSTFTWIDDFAAARNAALDRVRATHVLVLDADEWLTPTAGDPIRAWAETADDDGAGSVLVRSTTRSDGDDLDTAAWSVRLLPPGARYHGRVHEHPQGFRRVTSVPDLTISHDGYEPEQAARKRGRNEALLRAELVAAPQDPYLRFQLGRERQIAGDLLESADLYLSALEGAGDGAPWRDELRARLLFVLGRNGRSDAALKHATRFLREPGVSAEVLFAVGNLFLDLALARPANAKTFVDMAVGAWRTCLDVGEPDDGRDATPGCGSFLAAENLAAVCEARGDKAGRFRWATLAAELRGRT